MTPHTHPAQHTTQLVRSRLALFARFARISYKHHSIWPFPSRIAGGTRDWNGKKAHGAAAAQASQSRERKRETRSECDEVNNDDRPWLTMVLRCCSCVLREQTDRCPCHAYACVFVCYMLALSPCHELCALWGQFRIFPIVFPSVLFLYINIVFFALSFSLDFAFCFLLFSVKYIYCFSLLLLVLFFLLLLFSPSKNIYIDKQQNETHVFSGWGRHKRTRFYPSPCYGKTVLGANLCLRLLNNARYKRRAIVLRYKYASCCCFYTI